MDLVWNIVANGFYAVLCVVTGYLWNKLKYYDMKQRNTDNGLMALLKDRLISIYVKVKRQGYITFDQLDRANMIYEAYNGLGGNGTGTAIIKELRAFNKGNDDGEALTPEAPTDTNR